ncbi:unnamed protein product [Diamesa hyperborea]
MMYCTCNERNQWVSNENNLSSSASLHRKSHENCVTQVPPKSALKSTSRSTTTTPKKSVKTIEIRNSPRYSTLPRTRSRGMNTVPNQLQQNYYQPSSSSTATTHPPNYQLPHQHHHSMINLNYNQSNSTPSNCTFHTRQLDETIVGPVINNTDSPANSMSASPPPAPPPVPPLNPSCARCRHTSTATLQRQSQVIGSNPHLHASLSHQNSNYGIPTTNSYSGFDGSTRLMEEEDSACPALLEQDFNRYQRSVPGLRRSGVDANAIRQHFYPDGDWGWIVCSVAFLAHILTTGFQLSYGFLLLYAIKHLGQESAMEAGKWIISSLIYFIFLTKSHNL